MNEDGQDDSDVFLSRVTGASNEPLCLRACQQQIYSNGACQVGRKHWQILLILRLNPHVCKRQGG